MKRNPGKEVMALLDRQPIAVKYGTRESTKRAHSTNAVTFIPCPQCHGSGKLLGATTGKQVCPGCGGICQVPVSEPTPPSWSPDGRWCSHEMDDGRCLLCGIDLEYTREG